MSDMDTTKRLIQVKRHHLTLEEAIGGRGGEAGSQGLMWDIIQMCGMSLFGASSKWVMRGSIWDII